MPGTVSFTPTIDDWVTANRLWFRRARQQRWIRWLAIAASILALGSVGLGVSQGYSVVWALKDSGWMLVFAILLIFSPVLASLAIPRSVRRMFAQRPSLADPIDVAWDDDRITFTGATGHTVQPWTTLHRWVSNDRSILLLPSDRLLLLIPTRALAPGQADDLIETLRRCGVEEG